MIESREWYISDEPLDKLGGIFLKIAERNQVEQKAQKIFDNGGVEFVAANPDKERGRTLWEFDVHSTSGETYQVYGDSFIDQPQEWIDWRDVACGCPWGKWNYDRAPEYKHLESLQCSHSMASERWLAENGERENQKAIREQASGMQEIPFSEETVGPRKSRPGEQYLREMAPKRDQTQRDFRRDMQQRNAPPSSNIPMAPGADGASQPGIPGMNQKMQYPGGDVPGVEPQHTPAEINEYMDPNEEDGPQEVQEPQPQPMEPVFEPQMLMPRSPAEKKSWWKDADSNDDSSSDLRFELSTERWDELPKGYSQWGNIGSDEMDLDQIEHGYIVLTAFSASSDVGNISFDIYLEEPDNPRIEVDRIWVEPGFRRQGIGTLLYEKMMEYLLDRYPDWNRYITPGARTDDGNAFFPTVESSIWWKRSDLEHLVDLDPFEHPEEFGEKNGWPLYRAEIEQRFSTPNDWLGKMPVWETPPGNNCKFMYADGGFLFWPSDIVDPDLKAEYPDADELSPEPHHAHALEQLERIGAGVQAFGYIDDYGIDAWDDEGEGFVASNFEELKQAVESRVDDEGYEEDDWWG